MLLDWAAYQDTAHVAEGNNMIVVFIELLTMLKDSYRGRQCRQPQNLSVPY